MIRNLLENLFHLALHLIGQGLTLVLIALSYIPFSAAYPQVDAFWATVMYGLLSWPMMKRGWDGQADSDEPLRDWAWLLGPFAIPSLIAYVVCGIAGTAGLNWFLNPILCFLITTVGYCCLMSPSASRRTGGGARPPRGAKRSNYEDILKASGQDRKIEQ